MPAKALLLLLTMLCTACAEGDQAYTPRQTPGAFLLSQAGLDEVTVVPAANLDAITGDPFNARSGEPATVAEVMRQITANRRVGEAVTVGSVYTLRSFYHQNGLRGALKHVDVMIKREAGLQPAGSRLRVHPHHGRQRHRLRPAPQRPAARHHPDHQGPRPVSGQHYLPQLPHCGGKRFFVSQVNRKTMKSTPEYLNQRKKIRKNARYAA